MIRPLILDEAIKAEAAKVIEYAAMHHYIPGESPLPPGDYAEHVLKTQFGYRCVFSFTVVHGQMYRDLSVSVSTKGKYPNEFAFYTIATELFGFTGWDGSTILPAPKDWMIDRDVHYPAVRVVQMLERKP